MATEKFFGVPSSIGNEAKERRRDRDIATRIGIFIASRHFRSVESVDRSSWLEIVVFAVQWLSMARELCATVIALVSDGYQCCLLPLNSPNTLRGVGVGD